MSIDPKPLLTYFAPVVYLHSDEDFKPVSVDWYIGKCSLRYDSTGPGSSEVLKVINPSTPINAQKYDPTFGDVVFSSYAKTTEETEFYTTLKEDSHKNGNETETPPFYCAAYESGSGEGLTGHCDLIYGFFYAWDGSNRGMRPGLAGYFAEHEGDWEHIIVRIGPVAGGYSKSSKILGVFFQAHGSKDRYSNWYYPPGSQPAENTFEWETPGQTVRVYSAWGSHGSYVTAGTQPYQLVWPDDETDGRGTKWPGKDLFFMTGKEDWNDYNGRFGDSGGPRSPLVQGWLRVNSRQGGPDCVTVIRVARRSYGEDFEDGGFSLYFKLGYPNQVVWTVTAQNVTAGTINNLRFDFSTTILRALSGVKNGGSTDGWVQGALRVSNLWIEGTSPKVEGNEVFDELGIDELFLTATPS